MRARVLQCWFRLRDDFRDRVWRFAGRIDPAVAEANEQRMLAFEELQSYVLPDIPEGRLVQVLLFTSPTELAERALRKAGREGFAGTFASPRPGRAAVATSRPPEARVVNAEAEAWATLNDYRALDALLTALSQVAARFIVEHWEKDGETDHLGENLVEEQIGEAIGDLIVAACLRVEEVSVPSRVQLPGARL